MRRIDRAVSDFNPRTPAKECDITGRGDLVVNSSFQSTHPREGVRHLRFGGGYMKFFISIHAPPRRSATGSRLELGQDHVISIHAPPRRSATQPITRTATDENISIHAPPRRSATLYAFILGYLRVFQSTHPREGVRRELLGHVLAGSWKFQSTHPREGVRPYINSRVAGLRTFQSTHPREGVRPFSPWTTIYPCWISIHAPPRRSATPAYQQCFQRAILFQSTHPREGVRPQHIANRELHLLHIGCQTAEKPTVSVIFE